MGDLVRTIVVCGLISGTQPLTLMGLLVLLGGHHGRRNALIYVAGGFTVQLIVVLGSGFLVGGRVDKSSAPGHALVGVRILVGLALVALGWWFRRPSRVPQNPRPKALEKLVNLGPMGAFLAGVAIADYQGSVLAAMALTSNDVTRSQQFIAWAVYCLFATGIPLSLIFIVGRSERAGQGLQRAIDWVMDNRRSLISWICLGAGLLLVGDGLTTFVITA